MNVDVLESPEVRVVREDEESLASRLKILEVKE